MMNTEHITNKVLRGETDAAIIATIRLDLEFDRKYAKDPIGLQWVKKHLNTIRTVLEHLDQPLNKTLKIEQMMSLKGLTNFTSNSVKERIDYLIPLYEQLKRQEEMEGKRVVIAILKEGKSA